MTEKVCFFQIMIDFIILSFEEAIRTQASTNFQKLVSISKSFWSEIYNSFTLLFVVWVNPEVWHFMINNSTKTKFSFWKCCFVSSALLAKQQLHSWLDMHIFAAFNHFCLLGPRCENLTIFLPFSNFMWNQLSFWPFL